jgi:DNA-binding NarL/FixJ family response regulator
MTGRRWAARTAIAGTCLIALSAFWLSFTALADLAARSGIAERQAWAWPLIVDGIIVVATVSVVALAGQKSAWYPWMLLAGGALISVTANAVHAIVSADTSVPGILAAAVAAVPPIVLLAITHLTVILTRTPDDSNPAEASPQTPAIAVRQVSALDTDSALTPATAAPELLSDEQPKKISQTSSENETTADAPPSEEAAASDSPAGEPPSDRREQARMLRESGWSNKRIARHLGVHASTVGRWFALAHPITGIESDTAGDEP